MKYRNLKLLLLTCWVLGVNFSQDLGEAIEEEIKKEIKFSLNLNGHDEGESDPKFGLYLSNLDFEEAYELRYDHCYGVQVTGIVDGGNADRSGLVDGDIIMELDGEKVKYEAHLLRLRDAKKIGESVTLKIFRDGEIKNVSLTFEPETPDEEDEEDENSHLSVGFGGGGPLMFTPQFDFTGINSYIGQFGFDPLEPISGTHIGGFGMGTIGGGWFIGGMGGGFMTSKSIYVDSLQANRTFKLESGLGGVTLSKKYPLFTEKLILDFTTMIGGGETTLSISQNKGGFSWDDAEISNGNNWYAKYRKSFVALYPKVGVLLRIKNWIGIYGSAGQLFALSTQDGWIEDSFETTVSGDSPEVPNGLTYSVGIWFGY